MFADIFTQAGSSKCTPEFPTSLAMVRKALFDHGTYPQQE
jgi:hypothetical protein